MIHVSYSVTDNCKNLKESYGEICVQCNRCGRFTEEENRIDEEENNMIEQCSNCIYYRRLKHNFKTGIGFEESHCCVIWIKIDDYSSEAWVMEVRPSGMCEMFRGKQ